MSATLADLFGTSEDPRKVELIQNLIEKTRQGKIPWIKQARAAFTATIPGGFQINFVMSALGIISPHFSWQLLTVRDSSGNELIRVSNDSAVSIAMMGAKSTLLQAADELFTVVNSAAADDLDRAINTIKSL